VPRTTLADSVDLAALGFRGRRAHKQAGEKICVSCTNARNRNPACDQRSPKRSDAISRRFRNAKRIIAGAPCARVRGFLNLSESDKDVFTRPSLVRGNKIRRYSRPTYRARLCKGIALQRRDAPINIEPARRTALRSSTGIIIIIRNAARCSLRD